ncbi:hypothetical protein OUZ56_000996 [Daphnia magna]|uniref:Uncharacterized protein n=1 Tax=Daphnia magna TaxID=35525 RepID=A0ABR0A1E3_9CRUS|nr:hypothetical protein OUZ56_000996 [Daphnia magna]
MCYMGKVASNAINNGKFYIVNLITQEGQYVAIIPDFWFFDDSCYYPNTGGDIAASKRKQPERSWTHYKCSYRGEFGKNPSKKLGDVYQEQ